MKLYFTRHGETEWNTMHRMQGSSDSPLTILGITQAEGLHTWLGDIPLTRAYTSPQPRAMRTAQIALVGRDIELIPDARLSEACLGAFEGETFDAAREKYPEAMHAFSHKPDQFIPPGHNGETFHDVARRVRYILEEMAVNEDEHILIVTHALVLLTMRACMLNIGLDKLREGASAPSCCRCEAVYENGRWTLERFGEQV